MLKYMVLLGAIVNLAGAFWYIRSTLKGKIKPNKVSRLMRAIAPLIGSAAAVSSGLSRVVLPVFISGLAPGLVFIASFVNPKSYRKIEKFDYLCGIFSLLALVLRWITKDPLVAISLSILSSGFATIPTLIKSRKHPETESVGPYVAGMFNAITSIFAMKTFGFSEIAFPIYIFLADLILITVIHRKKFR